MQVVYAVHIVPIHIHDIFIDVLDKIANYYGLI